MDHPTHAPTPPQPPTQPPATPPARQGHDPLAVALGNASLLGLGYLMIGRRKLAAADWAVTAVLIALVVDVARPWAEVGVVVWWAAVVTHGWFLAGGRRGPRVAARGQRLVALGLTVPVLLAVGLVRYDAYLIEEDIAKARADGDCEAVVSAHDQVWFGHRVTAAPSTARGEQAVEACHRLRSAREELTAALTGDTDALKAGFGVLASVLAEPGNRQTVGATLDGFLDGLPTDDACDTALLTDWLRERKPSDDTLDRSTGAVARTAPEALVGCGADLMAADEWKEARARYRQLLDRYPGDERTRRAEDGVEKATLAIELANVRGLLGGPTATQPEYCDSPAKYSGADPYGKGTNRAMFYGNDYYTGKLPASWRTTDPTKAVLVVCAGDDVNGTAVRTCPYENKTFPRFPTDVTFHKIAVPVKVYELRTGKLVADRKVQIGGTSCPEILHYTTYSNIDTGPPSDHYVDASKADVRDGFRSLVKR